MNIFNNNSIIQTLYSIKYIQHTQKLMVHSGYSVCSAEHVPNPKRENQVTDTCEGNGVGSLFWLFVPLMNRTKCVCMLVGVFKSHIGNKGYMWWGRGITCSFSWLVDLVFMLITRTSARNEKNISTYFLIFSFCSNWGVHVCIKQRIEINLTTNPCFSILAPFNVSLST